MTDISSTTVKPDIPSMISPEDLAKKLVLEKRETWFPYGIMIADNSPAICSAVEAERAIAARQTCPACGRVHECPRGFSSEPAPENAAESIRARGQE